MTNRSTPALPDQADYATVHTDIVALLESARRAAARSVNALMTAILGDWPPHCRI
ncbi:hypothetical protein [Chitinilyticum piscinae]|uniref:hypothetical protein n=1 Tax=Chitinilyticum piscinae TaxID=2866724 RepID=UPI001D16F2F6|nr:hypothetical protein [Chitinilyticum piscinae]